MIEIFFIVYVSITLILGLISLIFLNKKFKKMGNLKTLLFIIFQPILIVREIIEFLRK